MSAGPPQSLDPLVAAATAELAEAEGREQVPDSLTHNVMRDVWADLRRLRMLPLPDVSGPAFVAQHVVNTIVERALVTVPDLQVHNVVVTPDDTAGAVDETGYAAVSVRIDVATRYGSDLLTSTRRTREIVRRTVAEQFGWPVRSIAIDVIDLFLDGADDE